MTGYSTIVEIRDNGKGIDRADIGRIFEPYFTKRPGGMGLGLYATLEILKSNHVGVDIRSGVGLGTSFILSFGRNSA